MIEDEIRMLRNDHRAVILAHNYCRGDVQDMADFTGDSLELARKATEIQAETIVFCGVLFMAETAKILNPAKTVLLPDPSAGCPMAEMITAAQLRELKARHPGAKAVCYVNSTAEVKAECDICVTSGNAEKVMATLKGEEVIFVPDMHLGGYISKRLGEHYTCWKGYCPIHDRLELRHVAAGRRDAGPDAPVLVHPECAKEVREAADHCLSTGEMCKFAKESPAGRFVIGTEKGILHRLRKENPEKEFVAIGDLVCEDMKKITLEKLRDALFNMRYEVTIPEEISNKARKAIQRMLEVV
jgi:quinolinate synthase